MSRLARSIRRGALALGTAALAACGGARVSPDQDPSFMAAAACSRWNPSLQTEVLEAIVAVGGPRVVRVDGWACGRSRHGSRVHIVFLRYRAVPAETRRAIVPVVFEDGRHVANGWELLASQPDRYGTPIDPTGWGAPEWKAPPGWIVVRSGDEIEATEPAR